ncbi:MAG: putative ABC transporter permease [Spirochaetaceae bacterium]|nr:putative ABC transporter permease [Spirochaetaceae bacterium]
MNISYVFILFLIYSFIGWLWETSFCSIKEGRFINRGFLHGPLCPVYGFGGMLVLYLLEPLSGTWIPLFLAAMVVTSLLEYFTSWILETLFHTKWWDYSNEKFNLNGRIFLGGALCFGAMGTLISHFVHPFLEKIVLSIPLHVAKIIAWTLFVVFMVDLISTVKKLVHFTVHMARLKEFVDSLKDRFAGESWFTEHSHSIPEMFEAIKEKAREQKIRVSTNLLEKMDSFSAKQERLTGFVKKYPAMSSAKFKAGLENLHSRVRQELEERKKIRQEKKGR